LTREGSHTIRGSARPTPLYDKFRGRRRNAAAANALSAASYSGKVGLQQGLVDIDLHSRPAAGFTVRPTAPRSFQIGMPLEFKKIKSRVTAVRLLLAGAIG